MSTTAPTATAGTRMDSGEDIGAIATIRLGMKYSPELREGLGLTLLLAIISSCGQIVVPIAVQQTLDRGLNAPGRPAPRLRRLDGRAGRRRDRAHQLGVLRA